MKVTTFVKIFLSFVFSLGVVLLLPKSLPDDTFGNEQQTYGQIPAEAASTQQPKAEKLIPEKIIIPSAGIHANIKSAYVNRNDWVLYKNYVSYLESSAGLGEYGNTVLYAHNTRELFANLKNVAPNDKILIESDGKTFSYIVNETKVVEPTQLDIVFPSDSERVTLFTCTDFTYEDRVVVVAKRATSFEDLL
jgi:sortase A